MANKSEIIFADEPTGNLDSKNTNKAIKLLNNCVKEFNQTLIMITHNNDIDKIIYKSIKMQDGTVISK